MDSPIILEPQQAARSSIIWLHGLGADGNDFVPIAQFLNLNETRFIFPNAPIRPITINMGIEMRGWYDIYSFDRHAKEDQTGIEASADFVQKLIKKEIESGIPSEKIVVAGFSQGAAIALHAATRFKQPLGGILALSGYLPLAHLLKTERAACNLDTPLFIAHGEYDNVLPKSYAELSAQALRDNGFKPEVHLYPIEHSVSDKEVEDIAAFLARVL